MESLVEMQIQKKNFFFNDAFRKPLSKKTYVLLVEKAKLLILKENCTCFFNRDKNGVVLKAYFRREVLPCPPGYGPGFISINFDSIVDQW